MGRLDQDPQLVRRTEVRDRLRWVAGHVVGYHVENPEVSVLSVALLLLVPAAAAYTLLADCSPMAVSDTVPPPNGLEVPLDARPAVTFFDGCGGGGAWQAVLTLTEDGSVIPSVTTGLDDLTLTFLAEVFPDEELLPETEYTLQLTPEGGEMVSVGFTTGLTYVEGLTGTPVLTVSTTRHDARERALSVSWSVKAAADPDVLSVLQLRDAEVDRGIQSFVVPASGATERTLTWEEPDRPAEVCPQVRQIDGAGVATAWSEPVCTAVSACGCAAGQGPWAGLVGILAALGMMLRRTR